jgi:hypothetical protein
MTQKVVEQEDDDDYEEETSEAKRWAGRKFPSLMAIKEKQFLGSDDDSEDLMSKSAEITMEHATEWRKQRWQEPPTTQLKMALFLKMG